jgi:ATP-dependent Zn protease
MKYTYTIMCLVIFLFLGVRGANAITISKIIKITIVPTATPTPITFKKVDPDINLKLVVSASPTPESKFTVTPEPSLNRELTVAPTQEENTEIIPSVTISDEKNTDNKNELKSWFMNITLGLLVLIIVIQVWPRKKVD